MWQAQQTILDLQVSKLKALREITAMPYSQLEFVSEALVQVPPLPTQLPTRDYVRMSLI